MSGFPIEYATRIKTLPPYLFAAIDKMKQEALARGVDIINLGIGDPRSPDAGANHRKPGSGR